MKLLPATATRHALRVGTRASHDRVDAQFADGLGSAPAYAAYVRGMHAFVSGIDAALCDAGLSPLWQSWSLTPRAHWLQADLDALALSPITVPGLPAIDGGPGGQADAQAAGMLYVLEGSALGARLLLDGAHRLGHDGQHGALFLTGHADGEQGRRWPRSIDALGSSEFDDATSQASLLAAANAAFAQVERCFSIAARCGESTRSGATIAITSSTITPSKMTGAASVDHVRCSR